MKIFMFHLMPWQYLPDDFKENNVSSWVTYSNKNYDPEKGAELYEKYLTQLSYAEELGFDGICVNEHHQTAYGLMPSPNVVASALIQRTSKVKIALLGNALPLRQHPLRVAEEVAMLDNMSKGRIICGFVRGIGSEYHVFPIDPTTSRDRFHEAHDLILEAWTKPGPFEWDGEHYTARYVNPWPRPYQDPHPPIWIPTQGSGETIEWVAENHYTLLQTFSPLKNIEKVLGSFHQICQENFGYTPTENQVGWAMPVYISDTDEKAYNEAKPHLEYLVQKLQHRPPQSLFPPGYLTERSMEAVLKMKGGATRGKAYHELIDTKYAIVGSAETVTETIMEIAEKVGAGMVVPMLQFGTMPHHQVIENMERFAREVMPKLKAFTPSVFQSSNIL